MKKIVIDFSRWFGGRCGSCEAGEAGYFLSHTLLVMIASNSRLWHHSEIGRVLLNYTKRKDGRRDRRKSVELTLVECGGE